MIDVAVVTGLERALLELRERGMMQGALLHPDTGREVCPAAAMMLAVGADVVLSDAGWGLSRVPLRNVDLYCAMRARFVEAVGIDPCRFKAYCDHPSMTLQIIERGFLDAIDLARFDDAVHEVH